MDIPVRIHYTPERIHQALCLIYVKPHRSAVEWLSLALVALLLWGGAIYSIWEKYIQQHTSAPSLRMILLGLMLPFVIITYVQYVGRYRVWQIDHRLRKSRLANLATVEQIDELGITIHERGKSQLLYWGLCTRGWYFPDTILLLTFFGGLLILERSFFESAADWQAFQAWMEEDGPRPLRPNEIFAIHTLAPDLPRRNHLKEWEQLLTLLGLVLLVVAQGVMQSPHATLAQVLLAAGRGLFICLSPLLLVALLGAIFNRARRAKR